MLFRSLNPPFTQGTNKMYYFDFLFKSLSLLRNTNIKYFPQLIFISPPIVDEKKYPVFYFNQILEYLPKTLDVIQQSGIEGLPALSEVSALSRLRPVPNMPLMETPQALSTAQQTISNIGAKTPTPGKYLQGKAKEYMQSALKPTAKQQQTGKAATAVDTLLENNLQVTKDSVNAMKNKIDTINEQIATKLETSTGTVNKTDVLKYLDELRAKKLTQVNPADDLAAINKVEQEFMQYNKPLVSTPTQTIPVQLAQKLKQGTYAALKNKYGQLGSAEVEAQKALARGLKEQIALLQKENNNLSG